MFGTKCVFLVTYSLDEKCPCDTSQRLLLLPNSLHLEYIFLSFHFKVWTVKIYTFSWQQKDKFYFLIFMSFHWIVLRMSIFKVIVEKCADCCHFIFYFLFVFLAVFCFSIYRYVCFLSRLFWLSLFYSLIYSIYSSVLFMVGVGNMNLLAFSYHGLFSFSFKYAINFPGYRNLNYHSQYFRVFFI